MVRDDSARKYVLPRLIDSHPSYFSPSNPALWFSGVYLLMYVFAVLPATTLTLAKLHAHINGYGVVLHFVSVLAFLSGAHAAWFISHPYKRTTRFYTVRPRVLGGFVYLCCIIALFVVLWQVAIQTTLRGYLLDSLVYKDAYTGGCVTRYSLLSREAGGLPGVIKMFSYLPLSALLVVLARESLATRNHKTKGPIFHSASKRHLLAIFLAMCVRSLFTLDRALIASGLIVLAYYLTFNPKKWNRLVCRHKTALLLLFILCAISVLSLHFVSLVRQGTGPASVISEYSSSGLANLSVMFESDFDYTLGLNLCNVVRFPMEYLGFGWPLANFDPPQFVQWRAGYLTSYAYNDFGLFSVFFFIVFGFFTAVVYVKARSRDNPSATILLFALVVAIATSAVVPLFRGPGWWLSVLVGLGVTKVVFNKEAQCDSDSVYQAKTYSL